MATEEGSLIALIGDEVRRERERELEGRRVFTEWGRSVPSRRVRDAPLGSRFSSPAS